MSWADRSTGRGQRREVRVGRAKGSRGREGYANIIQTCLSAFKSGDVRGARGNQRRSEVVIVPVKTAYSFPPIEKWKGIPKTTTNPTAMMLARTATPNESAIRVSTSTWRKAIALTNPTAMGSRKSNQSKSLMREGAKRTRTKSMAHHARNSATLPANTTATNRHAVRGLPDSRLALLWGMISREATADSEPTTLIFPPARTAVKAFLVPQGQPYVKPNARAPSNPQPTSPSLPFHLLLNLRQPKIPALLNRTTNELVEDIVPFWPLVLT